MSQNSDENKLADTKTIFWESNRDVPTIEVTEDRATHSLQEQSSDKISNDYSKNVKTSNQSTVNGSELAGKSPTGHTTSLFHDSSGRNSAKRPKVNRTSASHCQCTCKRENIDSRPDHDVGSDGCGQCPNCAPRQPDSQDSLFKKPENQTLQCDKPCTESDQRFRPKMASESDKRVNELPPSARLSSRLGKNADTASSGSSPKEKVPSIGSNRTSDSKRNSSPSRKGSMTKNDSKLPNLIQASHVDLSALPVDDSSKRTSHIQTPGSSPKSSPKIQQIPLIPNDHDSRKSSSAMHSEKSGQQIEAPQLLSPTSITPNRSPSLQRQTKTNETLGQSPGPVCSMGMRKEYDKPKDPGFCSTSKPLIRTERNSLTSSSPRPSKPIELFQTWQTSCLDGKTPEVPHKTERTSNKAIKAVSSEENKLNGVPGTQITPLNAKPVLSQANAADSLKDEREHPGSTDSGQIGEKQNVPVVVENNEVTNPEVTNSFIQDSTKQQEAIARSSGTSPHAEDSTNLKKAIDNEGLHEDLNHMRESLSRASEETERKNDLDQDRDDTKMVKSDIAKDAINEDEVINSSRLQTGLRNSFPNDKQGLKQTENKQDPVRPDADSQPVHSSLSSVSDNYRKPPPLWKIRPFELSVAGFCDANEMGYFPLQEQISYLEEKLLDLAVKHQALEDAHDALLKKYELLEEQVQNANIIARDQVVFENLKVNYQLVSAELEEARLLMREVKRLGWENLPQRMMQDCKDMHEKLGNARKERDRAIHEESAARNIANEALKQVKLLKATSEANKDIADQLEVERSTMNAIYAQAIKKIHEDYKLKYFAQQARDQRRQTHLEHLVQDLANQAKINFSGDLKEVMFHAYMGFRYPSLDECKEDALTIDGNPVDTSMKKPWHIETKLTPDAVKMITDCLVSPMQGKAPAAFNSTTTNSLYVADPKTVPPTSPPEIEATAYLGISSPSRLETSKISGVLGDEGDDKEQNITLRSERAAWDRMRIQLDKKLADKEEEILKLKQKIRQLETDVGGVKNKQLIEIETNHRVEALRQENSLLSDQYHTELVLRKRYHSLVEDLKGKIRVFCRIRPTLSNDFGKKQQVVVLKTDSYSVMLKSPKGMKYFQYDQVFGADSQQEDVFRETTSLVQSAIDGYNVCILAYGQTGSGKSYTLTGNSREPGLIPRAIEYLYAQLEDPAFKQSFIYDVTFSMYDLQQNDKIVDLLENHPRPKDRMEIKKDNMGITDVQGITKKEGGCAPELMEHFQKGMTNRMNLGNRLHVQANTCHLFTSIMIMTTNRLTQTTYAGKLTFVDLAKSDRTAKSGTSADASKEVHNIDQSLSALGDVMFALQTSQSSVPYRNSKLTTILQDSLGGNAKTLMIANLNPTETNLQETLSTLNYASRLKMITNEAARLSNGEQVDRLRSITERIRHGE